MFRRSAPIGFASRRDEGNRDAGASVGGGRSGPVRDLHCREGHESRSLARAAEPLNAARLAYLLVGVRAGSEQGQSRVREGSEQGLREQTLASCCPSCRQPVAIIENRLRKMIAFFCPACERRWSAGEPEQLAIPSPYAAAPALIPLHNGSAPRRSTRVSSASRAHVRLSRRSLRGLRVAARSVLRDFWICQ